MKNCNFLAFYLLIFISCNQTNNYEQKSIIKDFLYYYQEHFLEEENFLIVDELIKSNKYDELWYIVRIDSLKAKKFILFDIEKWDKTYFKNPEFVSKNELNRLVYNEDFRKGFYKTHKGFYTIYQPYISKDGNYILISVIYTCGERCGYSKIQLFKKQENIWQLVNTYSEGVS